MPPTSTGEPQNPLERPRGDDELTSKSSGPGGGAAADQSKAVVFVGIRNTGTRPITATDWEIIFGDEHDRSEYPVLKFRSNKEVPPGESLSISQKFSFDERWKRLQQAVGKKSATVKASIVGIEYADGSNWKRSS
jgi:hypothetical protein